MNIVLSFSLMLFSGFIVGNLFKRMGIPSITGYILTGVVFGESVLGIQTHEYVEALAPITNLGLGLIALTIGEELIIDELKRLGSTIISITFFQFLGTFIVVLSVMLLFGVALPLALILSAIASATAPAATTAVIEECKAKGPFTSTLLATIAIDDAVCIILFGLVLAVDQVLINGGGSLLSMIGQPFIEIFGSIIAGLIIAKILAFLAHRTRLKKEYLLIVLTTVLLDMELADMYHLSPLLVNMVAGFTLTNFFNSQHEIREVIEVAEVPIFVAFFTLAGAELQLGALFNTGVLGIAFIASRMIGKILGSWTGATVSKASTKVRRYLGLGLIPQAGVGVGLVFVAAEAFPQFNEILTSLVLASVAVSELIGPLAAKFALEKAGEINQEFEDSSLTEKTSTICA
ncbi:MULTISPECIES: cation:proton antiporter [unclassified Candidatus Frackibacter]|uniref:cation:proton antiporter n=1 Tax=unclassified Candidatus Frackibacter TaxID=2648818 RepID=UPI000890474F|nr:MULTISPECIES: cation:proton antiporter [unclassified Candidatus Frackibacter]SDC59265.1 Kef-type K+ transport system, membrane component KefB [Candidatus Frackibacter sp. WG11]SEM42473.1 Kef-type K+ transport system, membrane component KefB [Candidatus Frackibacter sp. WG12]SFL85338.1 Kef-type K+ transport system, membrane component KefB [Candidatus Frackibacter sp. WG13]